jgi:hypothetical protein
VIYDYQARVQQRKAKLDEKTRDELLKKVQEKEEKRARLNIQKSQ